MKTAGAAIYANRHYLHLYHEKHPERLYNADNAGDGPFRCKVIPDVRIHPSAKIHHTAVVCFISLG